MLYQFWTELLDLICFVPALIK